MSGQVLSGLHVQQGCRLDDLSAANQQCQQDDRAPQHVVAADRFIFDDLWRQRFPFR